MPLAAAMGVAHARERRARWQGIGIFPRPARRGAPANGDGASRPVFHRQAPVLAAFLHEITTTDGGSESDISTLEARASEIIRLLRLRAHDPRGPDASEECFYALVGDALRGLSARRTWDTPVTDHADRREPARRTATARPRAPRWITVAGELSAQELEEACRALGVRLNRARRTYWQSERFSPSRSDGSCGLRRRAAAHAATTTLAPWTSRSSSTTRRGADHPAKTEAWRCPARALAPVIMGWRREASLGRGDQAAEDAFYARILDMAGLVRDGRPIPGIEPPHRDVLPPDQHRIGPGERAEALRTTARVAQAIADGWLVEHGPGPAPERLVVWFRLERSGPEDWRIADAGRPRTSHQAQRMRTADGRAGRD